MIDTVIRNLASNALKFTSYNGSVTIGMQKPVITNLNGAEKSDSFVKVFLTDTGVGISNEDTTKLFRVDVQHSTTGTDDEAGIGLGLIMCKDMVEKNEGKIWIESELWKGTTFWFTVPVVNQ